MNPTRVYLAQSDTTVGFLSQDSKRLSLIKQREPKKPFIISVDSFETLKSFVRVPKKHKKFIRRTKKTTIVYPKNLAIRVTKQENHLKFLKKIKWCYTTSANLSGEGFDRDFALRGADVIVLDNRDFFEDTPSKIIKCGKITKRRLR